MRKILTAVALALTSLATNAQMLNGTYRVGDKITVTDAKGDTKEYIVGPNLAANGSFDHVSNAGQIYNWTVGTYADMTTDYFDWHSTGGHDGGAYIQSKGSTGANGLNSIVQRWTLSSNRNYYMGFWVKGQVADNQYVPVLSITSTKSTAGGQNEWNTGTTIIGRNGDDTSGTSLGCAKSNPDGSWCHTGVVFATNMRRYLQFNARWIGNQTGFDDIYIGELYDASVFTSDSIKRLAYDNDVKAVNRLLKITLRNYPGLKAECQKLYDKYALGETYTASQLSDALAAFDDIASFYAVQVEDAKQLASLNTTLKSKINAVINATEGKYPKCIDTDALSAVSQSAAEAANSTHADMLQAIKDVTAAIDDFNTTVNLYAKLHRAIIQLKEVLNTEYDDKAVVQTVVDKASAILYSAERQNDAVNSVLDEIDKVYTDYLYNRPSNWATIKNGGLWYDDKNRSVQAHGAGFVQVGDTWYMIGEDRNNTWNPDVNMYSTKDFVHWKFERKIIQNGVTHTSLGNGRFIERPKILYCKKTGKYVVWCHWEQGNYGASEAACFVCDSVNGPYKFVWAGRPLGVKSRDCTAYVDDDGTAYFISTTSENQNIGLFRLSDDYLSVVEHTSLFNGQAREAPAVVKVNGYYFMIFSACSGWDPNQASYAYSRNLKSGWSGRINIGNGIAFDTQASAILKLQGRSGTTYMYVGDRWQDPNLPESKTIMFPIYFNGTNITFNYRQQFDLDLATGTIRDTDTSNRISKKGWKVVAYSSQETQGENGAVANVIDGIYSNKWHTRYSGSVAAAPHFITVDMGAEHYINGFLPTPRTDGNTNGLVRDYTFEVSLDGTRWTKVSSSGWMPYWAEITFPTVRARYFRFTAVSGKYATLAEIDILEASADDPVVGIDDIATDSAPATDNGKCYDLSGRSLGTDLSSLRPGIYIKNGKKVLVK